MDYDPSISPPTHAGEKRAVIIIHGIGEQAPMQTLRSFVDAVWTTDNHLTDHGTRSSWTKPDTMSGNLELRRITTSEDKLRIRTDFYEFYWAHMMRDTRLSDVIWWTRRLLLRPVSKVPEYLAAPWRVGLIAIALLIATAGGMILLSLKVLQVLQYSVLEGFLWSLPALGIAAFLWVLRNRMLIEFVGDAARYLTAAPQNIAARTEIRKAGLAVLDVLHGDQEYDRIVLVCHSLGTVVGYDLLTFYWNKQNKEIKHDDSLQRHLLREVEAAARTLKTEPTIEHLKNFRTSQRNYSRVILEMTKGRWKITDFVTFGCPLTHAHILLTNDRKPLNISDTRRADASWIAKWHERLGRRTRDVARVLASRIAERAYPSCPPESEGDGFSYSRQELNGKPLTPNHAAVFSAVRWTNVYAPRRFILWGDVIAGPVAPLFGPGVKDVALKGAIGRSLIAHVKYWLTDKRYDEEHLAALRAGVNLLDECEQQAWARYEQAATELQ